MQAKQLGMKPFFHQNANPPIIRLTIAPSQPFTSPKPSVIIADSDLFADRREQREQREQGKQREQIVQTDSLSVILSDSAPSASFAQEAALFGQRTSQNRQ